MLRVNINGHGAGYVLSKSHRSWHACRSVQQVSCVACSICIHWGGAGLPCYRTAHSTTLLWHILLNSIRTRRNRFADSLLEDSIQLRAKVAHNKGIITSTENIHRALPPRPHPQPVGRGPRGG